MHPRNIKRKKEEPKEMKCPKCHKDMKLQKDGWHCYHCK